MSQGQLQRRLGVSEIVASLILLFIVSSLGVFLYSVATSTTNYQIDVVRGEASREIKRAQERFRITAAVKDGNNYTIAVLNYGDIEVVVSEIYLNGDLVTNYTQEVELLSSELELINFTYTGAVGSIFEVTLVSERGVSHVYVHSPGTT